MATGITKSHRLNLRSVLRAQHKRNEKIKYIKKWTTLSAPSNNGTEGKSCGGSKDKVVIPTA